MLANREPNNFFKGSAKFLLITFGIFFCTINIIKKYQHAQYDIKNVHKLIHIQFDIYNIKHFLRIENNYQLISKLEVIITHILLE